MSSFVREILSASGKLGDKEDFMGKALRLEKRMDDLKTGLRVQMEGHYVEFVASFSETQAHLRQMDEAVAEVEALSQSLKAHLKPELAEQTQETRELWLKLQELAASVQVANRVRQAYTDLEQAKEFVEEKSFFQAASTLEAVHSNINDETVDLSECDENQLKAFEAAKVEYILVMELLQYELGKNWDSQIGFVTEFEDGEDEESLTSARLLLKTGSDMASLVQGLRSLELLSMRLGKLGAKLMQYFFRPIMLTDVMVNQEDDGVSLTVQPSKIRPEPQDVFANISCLLENLHRVLDVPIDQSEDSMTAFQLLGLTFSEDIVELLVRECLLRAVPSEDAQLKKFEDVLENAKKFRSYMIDIKFIESDEKTILEFAANLDRTFADKKVADILGKARELAKRDLHQTRTVTPLTTLPDDEAQEVAKKLFDVDIKFSGASQMLKELELPDGASLYESPFIFPKCEVSEHVFEIIDLVRSTLEDACQSSLMLAGRLLEASRLIFVIYPEVIRTYHDDSWKQFPQHAALALTNCLYLAHLSPMIGFEYRSRLPSPLNENILSMSDFVRYLRDAGLEVFTFQLEAQQKSMNEALKASGFSTITGEAELPPNTEKCLRQILHQLHHLRKVWQHVLPAAMYKKAIGSIANYVVGELINRVVALEDIAADSAQQISSLFNFMKEKLPDVFVIEGQDKSSKYDILRYLQLWQKFDELILVLNANLKEIDDRWANGKGPLASEFSVEEIKHLIRALFQNTDRRAAVLSRIRYET